MQKETNEVEEKEELGFEDSELGFDIQEWDFDLGL